MAKLGRRMGLKTPGQKCRVGSIPTSGTTINKTLRVAQSGRALDLGSRDRRFEPFLGDHKNVVNKV